MIDNQGTVFSNYDALQILETTGSFLTTMNQISGFSVIMPTYNQGTFIRNAIQSLFCQTYSQWELIIINDGCTDYTEDFIADYIHDQRIVYLKNDSNKGLGYSINRGLDKAIYNHIAYLPSDDFYFPEHLETLKQEFEQNDELTLVYTLADSDTEDSFVKKDITSTTNGLFDLQSIQLVQTAHKKTSDRWTTRIEWVSTDLFDLFFNKLTDKGGFKFIEKRTCRWVRHPHQRHKIISESFGGSINKYRQYYSIKEPIKLKVSENKFFDETILCRNNVNLKDKNRNGLKILLVGELSSNSERICALTNAGHELYGLWMQNPTHSFHIIGPLPYGNVQEIPYKNWQEQVKKIKPDIIYALQSFGAVSIAHEVMSAQLGIPFVWHCKEGPSACLSKGDWNKLIELYYYSDGKIYINEEAKLWYEQFMPNTELSFIMDGDLPLQDSFTNDFSPKLSDSDNAVHTVVPGRIIGITEYNIKFLSTNNIHIHLYTENYYNSRLQDIRIAAIAAPYHFHVHDHCPTHKWVSEFSQYDAGWLHCIDSNNGGDMKKMTWDDLNIPARINTLAAAGLPMIQKENAGHIVAMQNIAKQKNVGIFFKDIQELVVKLKNRKLLSDISKNVIENRHTFTFDYYLSGLVHFFHQVISDSKCKKKI